MSQIRFEKADDKNWGFIQSLFPSDASVRWQQIESDKIDVYAVFLDELCIGRMISNYDNHLLETETIPNERVCLSHLILLKEHRGKGYGTSLLEFTLDDLKRRGYTEFTVGVEEENLIAKHLYQAHGFTRIIDHGTDPCEYNLYLKKL